MDGLIYEIPLGGPFSSSVQMSIDDENAIVNKFNYVIIKNWRNGKDSLRIPFNELTNKERRGHMKFDVAIFNPPYQEERDKTSDKQIYYLFLDEAYKIATVVETITPGRFLFNAGRTPKEWNKKMLNDEHIKVVYYEQDSSKIFPTTDIKGGVAIVLRDKNHKFGAITQFSQFEELNSIAKKMKGIEGFISLNTIMYPYSTYQLTDYLFNEHPDIRIVSKTDKSDLVGYHVLSNNRIITTNIFDLLSDLFFDQKPQDGNEYVCLWGRQNNQRVKKYINAKYIATAENYNGYKIIIPKSNGSGAIGEVLSTPLVGVPLVGVPLVGYTQSFLGIGSLSTEVEAIRLMKYIKTKFARTCLGILKITQDNPPEKWAYVPLQDFTDKSDIDWTQSITDIDKQLYKKYGLDDKEIAFIESKVTSMDDETIDNGKEDPDDTK